MDNIQPPIIARYQQYKFLNFNKNNIKYPKQSYTLSIKEPSYKKESDYIKEKIEKFFDIILALIIINEEPGYSQLATIFGIVREDVKNLFTKNEVLNSKEQRIVFKNNNKGMKIEKEGKDISYGDFYNELTIKEDRLDQAKRLSNKLRHWLMESYPTPTICTRDATFQAKKILSNDLNNNQSMSLTENKEDYSWPFPEVYSPTSPSMNNFTNDSYPLINPNLDTNKFNLTNLQNFSADNALYTDINYPGKDGTINPRLLINTGESFFQTPLTLEEKLEEINDGRNQFTL